MSRVKKGPKIKHKYQTNDKSALEMIMKTVMWWIASAFQNRWWTAFTIELGKVAMKILEKIFWCHDHSFHSRHKWPGSNNHIMDTLSRLCSVQISITLGKKKRENKKITNSKVSGLDRYSNRCTFGRPEAPGGN